MENYSSELSQVLDRCLEDVQSGRATIEQCLQHHPELRDQLEPQLRLALRLSSGRSLAAPERLRQAAWADRSTQRRSPRQPAGQSPFPVSSASGRIYRPVERQVHPDQRSARLSGRLSLSVAVLVALVFVLLSSGVVYASSQALPGGAFYTLKLAIGEFQLRSASNDLRRSAIHLEQASLRLDELDALPDNQQAVLVDQVLIDYTEHVTSVLEYVALLGDLTESEQVDFAQRIAFELTRNEGRLSQVRQRFDSTNQAWLDNALAASTVGLRFVEHVLNRSPLMQSPNLAEFSATATARAALPVFVPTRPASQEQPATTTPTPTATNNPAATVVVWGTPDPLEWLELLPSRPRLGPIWATIYPTLSNLATQLPYLSGTPRPVVRPTYIKPTLIPTHRPGSTPAPGD